MQHLIMLRGPIGAGKTTIAEALAGHMENASFVEPDALKRMICPDSAPAWRREIAVESGVHIARLLLEHGRTVITETPSLWPEQSRRFRAVAGAIPNVIFSRFLITAPYTVCAERSNKRIVPGMNYSISEDTLRRYYANLEPLPGETVIDTTGYSSDQATGRILNAVRDLEWVMTMKDAGV